MDGLPLPADEGWSVAGRHFRSRLVVGTGRYKDLAETARAIEASGAEMVTVAVRRDGSVESVTFVVSSGVAEVDEAIRRIVESQRPYHPFPAALAREYDVIEIRRSWYFDDAVRLQ